MIYFALFDFDYVKPTFRVGYFSRHQKFRRHGFVFFAFSLVDRLARSSVIVTASRFHLDENYRFAVKRDYVYFAVFRSEIFAKNFIAYLFKIFSRADFSVKSQKFFIKVFL